MLNISQRNAVAILNEVRSGLKYTVVEQIGPAHAPHFKVCVVVDGQEYFGVGGSKKTARCNAAENALKSFIQFPNNCKVMSNGFTVNTADQDFTSDFMDENLNCKQVKPVQPEKKTCTKGPVMLLNELFPNLKYNCTTNESDTYSRFTITVAIGEETFVGSGQICLLCILICMLILIFFVGGSKKQAKAAAATSALSKLLQVQQVSLFGSPNVSSAEQELADVIGRYQF